MNATPNTDDENKDIEQTLDLARSKMRQVAKGRKEDPEWRPWSLTRGLEVLRGWIADLDDDLQIQTRGDEALDEMLAANEANRRSGEQRDLKFVKEHNPELFRLLSEEFTFHHQAKLRYFWEHLWWISQFAAQAVDEHFREQGKALYASSSNEFAKAFELALARCLLGNVHEFIGQVRPEDLCDEKNWPHGP
jgi:hypothetical protein